MRIVGFVLMLAALYLAAHDALSAMYSTQGILLVLFGTLCLVRFTGVRISALFKAGSSSRGTPEDIRTGIAGWRMARICAMGMGLLGTLIGTALMLRNLNDPAQIGPGMSLALTCMLYALVVAPFCLALQARLEGRVSDSADGSVLGSAVLGALVAFLAPLVMCFALLLAFSQPPAAPHSTAGGSSLSDTTAVHTPPSVDRLAK